LADRDTKTNASAIEAGVARPSELESRGAVRGRQTPDDGEFNDGAKRRAPALSEERAALPFCEQMDPLNRVMGAMRPVEVAHSVAPPPAALDQMAAELLRRFSFSGRGNSGTVHLEFGAGLLEGGSVKIECEGRELVLTVSAPAGCDGAPLAARLGERLRARGLEVSRIEVS
jgi:hypothetical protein